MRNDDAREVFVQQRELRATARWLATTELVVPLWANVARGNIDHLSNRGSLQNLCTQYWARERGEAVGPGVRIVASTLGVKTGGCSKSESSGRP